MLRSWGVGIALCVAPAALRAEPAHAVIHGRVRIETSFRFLAENFVYRIISLFIRESGI